MSEEKRLESWEVEKTINELVEEWTHVTGETALERADLVIKKLKFTPKACEDCNLILTEPRTIHLNSNKIPFPHWKEVCQTCKKYRNPRNGKFEYNYSQTASYYLTLYKKNNKD